MELQERRVFWLDCFRSVAILQIIGFHMLYPVYRQLGGFNDPLSVLTEAGTMGFVLLSGYLVQLQAPALFYGRFLRGRFFNIVLPYALASLVLLGLKAMRGGTAPAPLDFIANYGDALLTGSASELFWFIPMIVIFYLAVPFFIWLARLNWNAWVLLLLLIPLVIGRGKYYEFWRNVIYFTPFFLLGMLGRRYRMALEVFFHRYGPVLTLAAIILVGATELFPGIEQLLTLAKILVCCALLGWCRRLDDWPEGRFRDGVELFTACGLGIYFYQNPVIGSLCAPLVRPLAAHGFAGALAAWALGTAICAGFLCGVLLLLRWILLRCGIRHSRYLIGA